MVKTCLSRGSKFCKIITGCIFTIVLDEYHLKGILNGPFWNINLKLIEVELNKYGREQMKVKVKLEVELVASIDIPLLIG